MRASNLTISVPYKGCDKNCPYCVSQMTGLIESNPAMMMRNLDKVHTLARHAQVSSVLITGKGEPCLNMDMTLRFIREFNHYPVELQTNGIYLNKNKHMLIDMWNNGLDIVAISIDETRQIRDYHALFKGIRDLGMTVRLCLNITKKVSSSLAFNSLVTLCQRNYVDQLLLRNITKPKFAKESGYTKWIDMNTSQLQYDTLVEQMEAFLNKFGRFLRRTAFGMEIWEYRGISITKSSYCIQDSNHDADIRSLIFMEDGHLYTNWDTQASRIL